MGLSKQIMIQLSCMQLLRMVLSKIISGKQSQPIGKCYQSDNMRKGILAIF